MSSHFLLRRTFWGLVTNDNFYLILSLRGFLRADLKMAVPGYEL